MKVTAHVEVTASTKVKAGQGLLKNILFLDDGLALSLPSDKEQRKEALLWLATQLENEARKL